MKELIAILTVVMSINSFTDTLMVPMHATYYDLQGTTASGLPTGDGICATGNKNLLGCEAILYQRLPDGSKGKYIGTYLIADTGCSNRVIDVWKPNTSEGQEFMDKVYEDGCKGKIWVEIRKVDW